MRLPLLCLLLLDAVFCYKFLCYSPIFGRSHVIFLGKLADALIDEGHEVVILSPLMDTNTGTFGTKKARIITVPQCAEAKQLFDEVEKKGGTMANSRKAENTLSFIDTIGALRTVMMKQCNSTIHHPGLMEQLKEEKFDVAFGEVRDFCGIGIFKVLGIEKHVITMSVSAFDGYFDITGMPSNPAYVPGMMAMTGEKMTFVQRLANSITFVMMKSFFQRCNTDTQTLFNEVYGSDFPEMMDIYANASLVFLNSEPLNDFPRPTVHKVIDIGGISVYSGHEPVNKTWSDILSLRPKTVLLSFGTIAKSYLLPHEYKKTILSTFRKFPDVTFIWKYERPEDKISQGVNNVIESTWVPQNDLLYDPRLTLFITHCGAGSTTEATVAGKPLIVIPVLGDQQRNAEMVRRMGTGVFLNKEDLKEGNKLEEALKEALTNPRYRENALKMSQMIADRPFKVKDIFVRNMEFVAKYGPLRARISNLQLSAKSHIRCWIIMQDICRSLSIISLMSLHSSVSLFS